VHAQARNPICSNHESKDPECEHKVVRDDPNVIVHSTDSFVSKQSDDTLPVEEQNKFIWGWKEPLIAEWSHMSWNPTLLDTPQTVHDVGPSGSVGGANHKILVSYGRGNDGDVLNNMGRSNPHLDMDGKQSTNMLMSLFDSTKSWWFDTAP
jgi:hypothetical protein